MTIDRKGALPHLIEEAKKRSVFVIICVLALSYLMSSTSSSVLVNIPFATALIILVRYFCFGLEKFRQVGTPPNVRVSPSNNTSHNNIPDDLNYIFEKPDWRRKVDSSVVEEAMEHLARHLVTEWITDLWYSRLTPDTAGPEELVQIINGFFGEISYRSRNINLVNFLTRDIIDLVCTNLELFRASKTKIDKAKFESLTFDQRDMELKLVLSLEDKLHPALFSQEAEHKVFQYIMDAVLTFTFKSSDLDCSFFRCVVRELLSCAVLRPILNLATPRFINERIEVLYISTKNIGNGVMAQELNSGTSQLHSNISPDHISKFLDPSVKGVELVNLKIDKYDDMCADKCQSKDPLLSITAESSTHWSLLSPSNADECNMQHHHSGVEWVDNLDLFCQRKNKALTSEHFDNMWAKGINYKTKRFVVSSDSLDHSGDTVRKCGKDAVTTRQSNTESGGNERGEDEIFNSQNATFNQRRGHTDSVGDEHDEMQVDEMQVVGDESVSNSSSSGDEDCQTSIITGLDSPGTKVWDGRNNRHVIASSHLRHPLETSEIPRPKKTCKRHIQHGQLHGEMEFGRKKSSSQKKLNSKELPKNCQSHLGSSEEHSTEVHSNHDSEVKMFGRVHSVHNVPSSPSSSLPHESNKMFAYNFLIANPFLRLQSAVLGADIVKGGSKPFTAYSISVRDVNKCKWSIKRRFSHFEELHRRLKMFSQYNLHLPPKHILSTGLDIPIIAERCKLLDKYLKGILMLPEVAASIEVWDFLSVDSQTYVFSDSISIVETLPIGHGRHTSDKATKESGFIHASNSHETYCINDPSVKKQFTHIDSGVVSQVEEATATVSSMPIEDSGSDSEFNKINKTLNLKEPKMNSIITDRSPDEDIPEASIDPTLPKEWVPSNLYRPILDMVNVIFQLEDDGWIRRKAFWLAKQILQLGMGDAVDDWLIEKIQSLRKGYVIAAGIRKVEQILWPDGIFITKHPRRQQSSIQSQAEEDVSGNGLSLEEKQNHESNRRAEFVRQLLMDRAPAPIVGLVGRKKYEKCADDVYSFLQSSVCLKQLALDILQLLLVSIFPELDPLLAKLHDNKQNFGQLKL